MFNPLHRNLFMMGMVEAAGLGWEGRNEQAEMVALYIRASQQGAAAAKALEETVRQEAGKNLDGGYAYLKLARMAYYVNKDCYRKAVNTHIAELKNLKADV